MLRAALGNGALHQLRQRQLLGPIAAWATHWLVAARQTYNFAMTNIAKDGGAADTRHVKQQLHTLTRWPPVAVVLV